MKTNMLCHTQPCVLDTNSLEPKINVVRLVQNWYVLLDEWWI